MSATPTTAHLALQQALAHHRGGRLGEAEAIYRGILQGQPGHADANHNLGLLLLQGGQAGLALGHLKVALQSDAGQVQYWVSYIEALLRAGQIEAARQMLAQGRGRGLGGAALEGLAARLQAAEAGLGGPTRAQIEQVGALFEAARFAELEGLARELTLRYPEHGLGWHALGGALKQLGKRQEALAPLHKAVALLPADPGVHCNLGILLQDLGRLAEAEASFRQGVQIRADFAPAHGNLGNVLREQGRLAEAEASLRRALEIAPAYAEAHNNLGLTLQGQGRGPQAEASVRQALALKPEYFQAHANLGAILQEQGRLSESEASLRRALELKPDFAAAHSNLGTTLLQQGRLSEAEASYRRALELEPDHADAHANLGAVLQEQRRLPEAEASLRRALALKPDFADAYNHLGAILGDRGQVAEAEASYRRALELDPDFAEAHGNLGALLQGPGRLSESESCYRRAIELKPGFAEAHHSLAILLLGSGRFAEGWKEYAWRLRGQPMPQYPHLPTPVNPLDHAAEQLLPFSPRGARVALLKDQGLGDELFFLRFAIELRRRGAWVAYVADPRIAPFIRRAQWVDYVAEEKEAIEGVQTALSVGDLPLALGMTGLADIPPPIPLSVLPHKQHEIAHRLAPYRSKAGPLIGITWRAGDEQGRKGLLSKEIPAQELAAALRDLEARLVIVQRNPRPGEIAAFEAALGRQTLDFSDLNSDLEGMLALMSALDDYIGVSNTNMHLRASAGRTAHVLVPHKQDFRWMTDGDSSPWFPGFAIYRMTGGGSWGRALEQLRGRFVQE